MQGTKVSRKVARARKHRAELPRHLFNLLFTSFLYRRRVLLFACSSRSTLHRLAVTAPESFLAAAWDFTTLWSPLLSTACRLVLHAPFHYVASTHRNASYAPLYAGMGPCFHDLVGQSPDG